MAGSLATLFFDISANTKKLDSALKQAETESNKSANKMAGSFKKRWAVELSDLPKEAQKAAKAAEKEFAKIKLPNRSKARRAADNYAEARLSELKDIHTTAASVESARRANDRNYRFEAENMRDHLHGWVMKWEDVKDELAWERALSENRKGHKRSRRFPDIYNYRMGFRKIDQTPINFKKLASGQYENSIKSQTSKALSKVFTKDNIISKALSDNVNRSFSSSGIKNLKAKLSANLENTISKATDLKASTGNLAKSLEEAKKPLKEFNNLEKKVSKDTTETLKKVTKETSKASNSARSEVMKLAAEYRKQGFNQSDALKRAWAAKKYGGPGGSGGIPKIGWEAYSENLSSISRNFNRPGALGNTGEISSIVTKVGGLGSALEKVNLALGKMGPAIEVARKVAEPFIRTYINIFKTVVKTTESIALKIGQTMVNGLIAPLKKGLNIFGRSFGGPFGNRLGYYIGGGLAVGLTYKLKNLIRDMISGGGEFEQMTQGIQILFADTRVSTENNLEAINAASDKMRQNALMAYKNVGMNATEYMDMASGYATRITSELGGDTEKAADVINMAMQDMSDNWHLLGGDFELIKNAYESLLRGNYRTFDNLKLGYGQTKTEVERLLADAEKLSGVHYDIDNLSDIMLAIHEIQKATGMTGTTAREALTTWAGATNMLKNAWINFKDTVGQGLIWLLRPVLQVIARISDALVAAGLRFMAWAQKITGIKDMVIGKKNDKDYSSAATGIGGINDAIDGVGGSAGKAKKAVKDLKRELMGFDQINKLTGENGTDTGSGTSGGSGSGTGVDLDDLVDQSWMNRLVESAGEDIETIYEKYLKEAWEKADFAFIGTIVARKIAEALDKINWVHIQEICGKIGKSFATFLNGIFASDELWSELGETLAGAINSIIEIAYKFVTKFNYTNFGTAIATGLNHAISNIDTSKIGVIISERIKGMLDAATAFISVTDFKKIVSKLYTLLFNIDFPSIKEKAGNLGEAIANALNDVFSNRSEFLNEGFWDRLGKSFGNSITAVINFGYKAATKFEWDDFGEAISTFLYNTFADIDGKKLGQTIYETIHGIFTTIKTVLEDDETWDTLYQKVTEALEEIKFDQLIADAFTISDEVARKLWRFGKLLAHYVFQGFIEYLQKEHPIAYNILTGLLGSGVAGMTAENSIGGLFGVDTKTQYTVELIGDVTQSFKDMNRSWAGVYDKTAKVTGTGLVQGTLTAVYNTVRAIQSKPVTVSGYGNTTTSLKNTDTTIKGIHNKTAKVTATGERKQSFNTTEARYKGLQTKTVTVKMTAAMIVDSTQRAIINSLSKAFNLNIPKLAQGGFVKRNTPQLAIIGDNRREGEIVAPESKLAAMAQMAAGSGNAETNALLRQLIGLVASMNLNVELDGEAIKNNTVRRINNHTRSTGQLEILI